MATTTLTGRLSAGPARQLHDEVLAPQFQYEIGNLLPCYVLIEKILVLEYRRMNLVTAQEAQCLAQVLHELTAAHLIPEPDGNMSDVAFAIERHVESRLPRPVPAWHVDRSRNDLQATAQLMFARTRVLELADDLLAAVHAAHRAAAATTNLPMPAYTQMQAAQVSTPAFHLTALADQLLRAAERLLATYDWLNRSPLGAGSLSGQEVAFDRVRMARLAGFTDAQPHALVCVASRGWALDIAGELSHLGVTLSRFATDLMHWAGSDRGFVSLPDELAGISSAMPQKRNYPVLERIRGRSAHLTSAYFDVALAQRNTPYTNMVEVSKESTAGAQKLFDTAGSVLRLLTTVLGALRFHDERMRASCDQEFLGGFTLANQLTLTARVPWRQAQVVAGRYVSAVMAMGLDPGNPAPALLTGIAEDAGYLIEDPAGMLVRSFGDAEAGLRAKISDGSTAPASVEALICSQSTQLDELWNAWQKRGEAVSTAWRQVDLLLDIADTSKAAP